MRLIDINAAVSGLVGDRGVSPRDRNRHHNQSPVTTEIWTTGGVDSFWEKIANRFPDRMFVGNEINASSPGGAHAIFLGLWRFLFLMLWGTGLEVVFDRFSSADTYETVVRANILANVGITFPAAFKALTQTV